MRERPRPQPTLSPLVEAYRSQLRRREEELYGPPLEPSDGDIVTEAGGLATAPVLSELHSAGPDLLLVFGTSILSPRVLAIPRWGTLNIHTGITQLFRGVDSTLWAIHEGRPEGIGATVHQVDASIDGGPVFGQARPTLTGDEDLAALFFLSVELGWSLMRTVVSRVVRGDAVARALERRGKLYRLADMTDGAVRRAQARVRPVLAEYLSQRTQRDRSEPIFHP